MDDRDFHEVALSYQKQVWNAALRMADSRAEAEDFFQETYRRAFDAAATLRNLAHCRAWLFRILTSLVIDLRRRERRAPVLTLVRGRQDTDFLVPEPTADFHAEMIERLSAEEIARAIGRLPREQRAALTLCDVEGFTYQEIAEMLACPIGTVRSRIARARGALMVTFEERARRRGIGRMR